MFAVIEKDLQENEITDVVLCNTDEEYIQYLQERLELSEEAAADIACLTCVWLIPDYDEEDQGWRETTAAEDNDNLGECELLRMDVVDRREEEE